MTVQEFINKLDKSYPDKSLEIEFVVGASINKPYSRARFMESGIAKDLRLTPEEGSQKACIQLYP